MTPYERARDLLDKHFGFGVEEAHAAIRKDVHTKAIYDCAVRAIAEVLEETPPPDKAGKLTAAPLHPSEDGQA